jgi:hypothetical protein
MNKIQIRDCQYGSYVIDENEHLVSYEKYMNFRKLQAWVEGDDEKLNIEVYNMWGKLVALTM